MTPAARVAAAIEILDLYLSGEPAEKALTSWGRSNRFAGSKDRAAIRDHVFDAIRNRRSLAALGGAETGRGLMIGSMRQVRSELSEVFSGEGYAPAPLTKEEAALQPPDYEDLPDPVRLNYPDWLEPELRRSLGDDLAPVMEQMRLRAPVFVRVNLAKADLSEAAEALRAEAIETAPCPLADTALLVTHNARRVHQSRAYLDGLVELQDAASQAVVAALGPGIGTALDYCAGGGGKALTLAAQGWAVTAHDVVAARMKDIAPRAQRAGAEIEIVHSKDLAKAGLFDLVLVDAPCSGSGAWRRQPEARWSLTADRLAQLQETQAKILGEAEKFVRPGGRLAYATCSLLRCENQDQSERFHRADAGWSLQQEQVLSPLAGGDGFFISIHEKTK